MEGCPGTSRSSYQPASPLYGLDTVNDPDPDPRRRQRPAGPAGPLPRPLPRARHYLDIPTELVVYPGEGHGLTTHENRLAKMEWDLAWFRKYLMDEGPAAQ